jgi:hypothetical protein
LTISRGITAKALLSQATALLARRWLLESEILDVLRPTVVLNRV